MNRLLSYPLSVGLLSLHNPSPNSNYVYPLLSFRSLPLEIWHHISSNLLGHERAHFFTTLLLPTGTLIILYKHSSRSLYTDQLACTGSMSRRTHNRCASKLYSS